MRMPPIIQSGSHSQKYQGKRILADRGWDSNDPRECSCNNAPVQEPVQKQENAGHQGGQGHQPPWNPPHHGRDRDQRDQSQHQLADTTDGIGDHELLIVGDDRFLQGISKPICEPAATEGPVEVQATKEHRPDRS